MGKAKILGHLGGGLYSIEYMHDVTYAKARIADLDKQIRELDLAIYGPNGLTEKLTEAELEIDRASTNFNNALAAWSACAESPTCTNEKELMEAVKQAGKDKTNANTVYMQIRAVIADFNGRKWQATKEKGWLNSTAVSRETTYFNAWSVDHPGDDEADKIATGTLVGTVETYGVKYLTGQSTLSGPAPMVNVQRCYTNQAVYTAARDGRVLPISSQPTSGAIMNVLQFLYANVQNPVNAMGTVIGLNRAGNTMTVELFGNTLESGAAPDWPFGKTTILTNVPVSYRECNCRAFNIGDKVIVAFGGSKRANPVVIGFASNPKPCEDYIGWKFGSGIYSENNSNTWDWTPTGAAGGNLSWYSGNSTKKTCSWWGRVGKHFGPTTRTNAVYHQGVTYAFSYTVFGACMRKEGSTWYIYALTRGGSGTENKERMYKVAVGGSTPTLVWEGTAPTVYPAPTAISAPSLQKESVFFDSTGSVGVGMCGRDNMGSWECWVTYSTQNSTRTAELVESGDEWYNERIYGMEYDGTRRITAVFRQTKVGVSAAIDPYAPVYYKSEVVLDGQVVHTIESSGYSGSAGWSGHKLVGYLYAMDIKGKHIAMHYRDDGQVGNYNSNTVTQKIDNYLFGEKIYDGPLSTTVYGSGNSPPWTTAITQASHGFMMDSDGFGGSTIYVNNYTDLPAFQCAWRTGHYICQFGSQSTLKFGAAPYNFRSDVVSQTLFQSQSGKTLPYGDLGVHG